MDISEWTTPEYVSSKIELFNSIDQYIQTTPATILDIGCGLAFESELFQKKYNSELYLLDGERANSRGRFSGYNPDEKKFTFYNNLETIKQSLNNRNVRYNFIDANNIKLDNNIKFDLIYSVLSCGHHYPVDVYKELVTSHSHNNSIIIMDIRKSMFERFSNRKDVEIISVVKEYAKNYTTHFKFC